MAALGSEHEWIIPFILKCIVHQQTVKLQNSFQIAERMAYLLRSGLWHREVHDLLSRKTLGDHGIEKEKLSPPSNQFPGTPWSCMLPEITTHLDLNIRVSFKNQTGSYVSDISEHTQALFSCPMKKKISCNYELICCFWDIVVLYTNETWGENWVHEVHETTW